MFDKLLIRVFEVFNLILLSGFSLLSVYFVVHLASLQWQLNNPYIYFSRFEDNHTQKSQSFTIIIYHNKLYTEKDKKKMKSQVSTVCCNNVFSQGDI